MQKCTFEARYEIEREILLNIFGELRENQRKNIDKDFIIQFIREIRENIYQEIQIYEAKKERITFEDALGQWNNRCVILGHPGSGKSTLLRHKALVAARNISIKEIFPILVELRDLNNKEETLWNLILKQFTFTTDIDTQELKNYLETKFVQGKVLLLLDGLDEVDENRRNSVREEISSFLSYYKNSPCAITCRILGYLDLLPYKTLELAELDGTQIREFTKEWFIAQPDYGEKIFKDAQQSSRIWRMVRNPFLLTMYCIARRNKESFHFSRSSLYSTATSLLLEAVDKGRGLKRNQQPIYIKKMLLSNLAAHLLERAKEIFIFDEVNDISNITEKYNLSIIENSFNEIVNNSGIVRQLSDSYFGFAHLSIQEYYAALHYANNQQDILALFNNSRYWEMLRLFFGIVDVNKANSLLENIDKTLNKKDWRFVAFISSCIIEMPIISAEYINQTAKNIISCYHQKDIDQDAKAILIERFIDVIQRDKSRILDPLIRELIKTGYEDLDLAVTALLVTENENNTDMLREALITLEYNYARQVAEIIANHVTPVSITLLKIALRGAAAKQAIELLGILSRKSNKDITDFIFKLLSASPIRVNTRNKSSFYFRLSNSIKPGLYPKIEAYFDYYIINVRYYTQRETAHNKFDGSWTEPDENFMSKLEEDLNIYPDQRDYFRSKLMMMIGGSFIEGVPFVLENTELNTHLEKLIVKNADNFYNSDNYNRHLWQSRDETDTIKLEGIEVDGEILFPGTRYDDILSSIYDVCESCFVFSYLNLPSKDISDKIRYNLIVSLEKALKRILFTALRKNVSITSYLQRAIEEVDKRRDIRVLSLSDINYDIYDLRILLYKYKRGRAADWWRIVNKYDLLITSINTYISSVDDLVENIKENEGLIKVFLNLKEISNSRLLKRLFRIIITDKTITLKPGDKDWDNIIPIGVRENDYILED